MRPALSGLSTPNLIPQVIEYFASQQVLVQWHELTRIELAIYLNYSLLASSKFTQRYQVFPTQFIPSSC
jgi:hypothetical protein